MKYVVIVLMMIGAVTSKADLATGQGDLAHMEVSLPGMEIGDGWSFYPKNKYSVVSKFDPDVNESIDVLTLITGRKHGLKAMARYMAMFEVGNPGIDISKFTDISVSKLKLGHKRLTVWKIAGDVVPEAGSVSLLIAGISGVLGVRRLLMM